MMSEPDKPILSWDFQLDFDLPEVKKAETPQPPIIPPRQLIGEKFPRILQRIELLWGTAELHQYFEHTLFSDRSNRQGFPQDVIKALGDVHAEHTRLLKSKGVIREDMWDVQFRK